MLRSKEKVVKEFAGKIYLINKFLIFYKNLLFQVTNKIAY